ncbi:MAG: hydrogenase maturation protease [Leptolyngbya sp. PLA3]|nr:MAG: hydrogenase maturation protease [Cyanobacteria bacterium CYA]MCE7967765.1 hydrogenase maturation protease [Leptolyngbya sp. PL-A3]
MNAHPSTLVIGYGNPGRQDDGLGPRAAEAVELARLPGVDVLCDYQLNVEHADDVRRHEVIVFIDAALAGAGPCFLRRLLPRACGAFSTHTMRPEAVLALARDTFGWSGRAFLLGIRGYAFGDFGEDLSSAAAANLEQACALLLTGLREGLLDAHVTGPPTYDSYTPCHGGEPCTKAST